MSRPPFIPARHLLLCGALLVLTAGPAAAQGYYGSAAPGSGATLIPQTPGWNHANYGAVHPHWGGYYQPNLYHAGASSYGHYSGYQPRYGYYQGPLYVPNSPYHWGGYPAASSYPSGYGNGTWGWGWGNRP